MPDPWKSSTTTEGFIAEDRDVGPAAPSTCSQTTPPLQQPKRVGKVPILGVWVLVKGPCALCTCCMSHANWALNGRLLQTLVAGSCWACLKLTCTSPLFFHPCGIKSLLSSLPNAAEDLCSTGSVNPGYFSLRRKVLFHSSPFSSIA